LIAWGALILLIGGGIVYNHFRSKKDWKALAGRLAIVLILFLAAIFVFGSGELVLGIAFIVSIVVLIHFFRPDWFERFRKPSDSKKQEKR
jgi:O-antigen/teichoic acid export membrane protein